MSTEPQAEGKTREWIDSDPRMPPPFAAPYRWTSESSGQYVNAAYINGLESFLREARDGMKDALVAVMPGVPRATVNLAALRRLIAKLDDALGD